MKTHVNDVTIVDLQPYLNVSSILIKPCSVYFENVISEYLEGVACLII